MHGFGLCTGDLLFKYVQSCCSEQKKHCIAKHFRKWRRQHAAYFFLLRLYSDGVMPVRERKALMNEDML